MTGQARLYCPLDLLGRFFPRLSNSRAAWQRWTVRSPETRLNHCDDDDDLHCCCFLSAYPMAIVPDFRFEGG